MLNSSIGERNLFFKRTFVVSKILVFSFYSTFNIYIYIFCYCCTLNSTLFYPWEKKLSLQDTVFFFQKILHVITRNFDELKKRRCLAL